MHGQRRLPPGTEAEAAFQEKLAERNAKVLLSCSGPTAAIASHLPCLTQTLPQCKRARPPIPLHIAQGLQAAKAQAATKAVLKARAAGEYSPAVMLGSKAVLTVFPDLFSLWNVRCEALASIFDAGGESSQEAAAEELALTRKCLEEHPKSYSAWHHRRWVVQRAEVDLEQELRTLEECASEDKSWLVLRTQHARPCAAMLAPRAVPKPTCQRPQADLSQPACCADAVGVRSTPAAARAHAQRSSRHQAPPSPAGCAQVPASCTWRRKELPRVAPPPLACGAPAPQP